MAIPGAAIVDPGRLIGPRDRALIGLMVFSFARFGAANTLRVGDYFQNDKSVGGSGCMRKAGNATRFLVIIV